MDLSTLNAKNLAFTTDRLTIRLMTNQDFEYFKQLQNDPELMTFIGPILEERALKEKFSARVNCLEDLSQWFTFLIFDQDTKVFCGSVGFLLQDQDSQRVEIGYLALPAAQGKGVITEAANALLEFIFNQLQARKVIANCAIQNIASWKVMEKLGLLREGELKSDFHVNDVWYDSYCYGLVNHQANQ
ncbi:GNAT family N-acetyltransferase [Thalassotalea sp. M1531]|uniref:GNAT family N-acetyltransferase n=1 Tax=Thalassotalea algicola TaxID=2716224 RepID=A0A7Y0LBF9_9GAMM|nr:GNAT family N-acetyltransferase [Thalassotalea algicola]NMP31062.1 GNAT family N-acetyltransferase [Thalassotalea algicola]